jgi:hypothetical protein
VVCLTVVVGLLSIPTLLSFLCLLPFLPLPTTLSSLFFPLLFVLISHSSPSSPSPFSLSVSKKDTCQVTTIVYSSTANYFSSTANYFSSTANYFSLSTNYFSSTGDTTLFLYHFSYYSFYRLWQLYYFVL